MNYRMIKHTLGWLLIFEAGFFILPLLTGIVYRETEALAFVWSILITAAIGTALLLIGKPKTSKLYSRDGFAIVALSWIFLSIFGSLPYLFSGSLTSFVDALFETVSGFTTTGSSVILKVEDISKCVLFWRSFTNWIGGMGVLVFIMAFIPLGGAHNLNIMKAESPGPEVSKLVPRVKTTALVLYIIYGVMTVLQFLILVIGGENPFDAICISFSSAGTGGFGIKKDSFASYTVFTQVVTTVFMFLFSINFNSYFLILSGKFKDAFTTEVKVFTGIVLAATVIITIDISGMFGSFGEALNHASFTVSTIISTTGFATANFDLWPALSKTLIVLLMFIGACAGSTGGGIKVSRIVILIKGMLRELRMIVHPKQVKKISVDGKPVDSEVIRSVNAYMICYLLIFVTSVIIISFEEYDLVTNFTAVAATLNNIGPGLGLCGPSGNFACFNISSKLVLIFDMLAGRLELFPMMILFSPATWKR